jgi:hypothetical protein
VIRACGGRGRVEPGRRNHASIYGPRHRLIRGCLTVALNRCEPPTWMMALVGVTDTEMGWRPGLP